MPKKATSQSEMDQLLKEQAGRAVPFTPGTVIEGTVISSSSTRVWVDINGVALGVVPERELTTLGGDLKPGDAISASVLVLEDNRGNVILSLRRASRDKVNTELEEHQKSGEPIDVKVSDANKGGLLIEYGDYTGFLPVSQLATEHYPRVDGGNPDEILAKLRELVGQTLSVKVINFDQRSGKLIFSEKAAGDTQQEAKLKHITEGEVMEGTITGIVDFGVFVRLGRDDEAVEGLVHISELTWGRVSDIHGLFEVGQKVKVLVVSTADNRVSLSIKRLEADPWTQAASALAEGQKVSGTVLRSTAFGAFVRLPGDIDGLVHISEITKDKITDPTERLEIGKEYEFKVISIDTEQHRIGLSFRQLNEPASGDAEEAPKKRRGKKVVEVEEAE